MPHPFLSPPSWAGRFLGAAAFALTFASHVGSVPGQAPVEPLEGDSPIAQPTPDAPPARSPRRLRLPTRVTPPLAELVGVLRFDLGLVPAEVRLVRGAFDAELTVARRDDGGALVALHRAGAEPRTIATLTAEQVRDRGVAHSVADRVLFELTGRRGGFDSALVFTQRVARRKSVQIAAVDGRGAQRVSIEGQSAYLPSFAHGDVWYSVHDDGSLYVTRVGAGGQPVLEGGGLTMGAQPCGDRVVFSSNRDGDAEIYSARPDGSDVVRLTFDPGIDVSPSCAPDGTLAFVSDRTGVPQIHVLRPGDSQPVRLPQPAGANQTPTFCGDPARPWLAFTQTSGRGMRVTLLDLTTETWRVVSPAGSHRDPAFSPDCRLLAMAGPGGLWLVSIDGAQRRRVLRGDIETVRWGPRRADAGEPAAP